jgi:hypothetical protein
MLMNSQRALPVIVSMCNLCVIFYRFLLIFHIIYKGNVVSFQCKISLNWSASMGEVDVLSLILIDLYVPLFMPRLH